MQRLAKECVDALGRRDLTWLTAHAAPNGSADQANLTALGELFKKPGVTLVNSTMSSPQNGSIDVRVQFQYSTSFGPKRAVTPVFRVRSTVTAGRWELASCRVEGTLALP
jgi:hypothetical protein